MVKFFQVVAPVMIVAVLGGTQCVELCSFLMLDRHAKASQTAAPERPCHRKPASQNSQPTDVQCSHSEFIAEKRSDTSSTDDMEGISLVALRIDVHNRPVSAPSSLTAPDRHFSRFSPVALGSILRI